MESDKDKKKELSGIVWSASRHGGALVGTLTASSKKLAGRGVSPAEAVKNLPTSPPGQAAPATDEATELMPEKHPFKPKPGTRKAKTQKNAVKAQAAALEPDSTTVQRDLKKARRRRKKDAKSHSSSDVSAVQTESETALSEQGQENLAEVPSPAGVTDKEVQAAVFPNATDKIIFTKALSYITSQDVDARADAARAIAGIRHKLSVRVLVAQMAHEPSPQVRQECINALTTLDAKEGLPVVKRALTDQAALVRLAAVRGLYRLAGAESAPALIRMLSDESEAIRRRAAACLGWLGQEELAANLLPLLADSSVAVRRAAVEAMANLRSWQVVPYLIDRLNDPDELVSKAILGAIEAITGKKTRGPFPSTEKGYNG